MVLNDKNVLFNFIYSLNFTLVSLIIKNNNAIIKVLLNFSIFHMYIEICCLMSCY